MIALLAGIWTMGVAWHALQLLFGWRRLARLVVTAREPGSAARSHFEACRLESGVRADVRLGLHADVTSPMFVGGRKRCILVPEDWESMPAGTRRAVLLHELAHVVRGDDHVKLVEELARVFFFFHPLVHLLLNRLDSAREEMCDAAAIRHGVSPRALARILFEFGRRAADMPPSLPATGAALPFFRRRTLKQRINGLLESPTLERWSAAPSKLQRTLSMLLAIVLLLVCQGVALRAAAPVATRRLSARAKPFRPLKVSWSTWPGAR